MSKNPFLQLTKKAGASLLLAASLTFSSQVMSAVINFDDLAGGDEVTNQYQNQGVVFSGGLFVIGPGAFTNPVSAPNSVFYSSLAGVTAEFFNPVSCAIATTDYVAFTPTDASSNNTQFQLIAFDVAGNQIGLAQTNVESTGVYSLLEDPKISLSVAGIHSVLLTGFTTQAGNYVIEGDNFEFNNLSTVPVPAGIWLFVSGAAGLLGFARRRAS